jgi:hypothetical protein
MIINVTKSISDSSELRLTRDYFAAAQTLCEGSDSAKNSENLGILYLDLSSKLEAYHKNIRMGLQSYSDIFQEKEVSVNIFVNGEKKTTGNYILFWADFRGEDQDKLIARNKYNGTSLRFNLPLSVRILVPGIVTFWLKDIKTQRMYKSVVDHIWINDRDKTIDLPLK